MGLNIKEPIIKVFNSLRPNCYYYSFINRKRIQTAGNTGGSIAETAAQMRVFNTVVFIT